MAGVVEDDVHIPVEKVDFLDQDQPIRGQNYVCLSFLSPEEVITKKEAFYFQRFMSAVGDDVKNLLDGIAAKFGESDPHTLETVNMLKERHQYLFSHQAMDGEFKFFSEKKEKELDKEFNETVQFRTSVRGIKVRGVYESLPEAMKRVESIKRLDNKFNVYVAEMGCWCPWSPNPEDIQDAKYAETQLNTLMKSYKDNLSQRDEYYQSRKNDLLKTMANQPKTHSEQQQTGVSDALTPPVTIDQPEFAFTITPDDASPAQPSAVADDN